MKKLLILVFALYTSVSAFSQYSQGTIKVALALGNSPYTNRIYANNPAYSTQYPGEVSAEWISGKSNSLVNMVGMEFKYFLSDGLALKFIGGGQTSYTPAQNAIPGTSDGSYDPTTDIPAFAEVEEETVNQYLFQVGADKYFIKNNVALYGGGVVGFRYGSAQAKSISETSSGTSISEVYGYYGALNCGAEYGTAEGLFVGLEIQPVSLSYNVGTIEPVPGASQTSTNTTFGFFVYPMLRVGVNF